MNLITVRIVKSVVSECDWAGVTKGTSHPTCAVEGLSRESVLTLPRERTVRFQIIGTAA